MAHSCCKTNRGAHFLDERIPEWQLLQDVRPIFASSPPRDRSTLQWSLTRDHKGSVDNDAEAVEAEYTLDFFKHEMRILPEIAPKKALSCEVFDNCFDNLSSLLRLLDGFVKDCVFNAPCIHEPEGSIKAIENNARTEKEQVNKISRLISCANYIYSWMLSIEYLPISPSEPPTERSLSTSSPKQPEDIPTGNLQSYSKLQVLGKIVDAALQEGADVVQECSVYITLEKTLEEYEQGVETLKSFNMCFESSDVSELKPLNLSCPLTIPRTRWEDPKVAKLSNQLFDVLHKKFSGCHGDQQGRHEAMLRLSGVQLEDRPLVFNVFFLTCKHSDYWQESRFMPIENSRGAQKPAVRQEYVHNLCKYIIDQYHKKSNSDVLNISFDEKKLLATTADLLAHHGASPAMSLEDLLKLGFFRKPTAGGAFSPGDKAVLALSLTRCLLHLLQSQWIEQPWTAESIHFLHKRATAEILDVHHPYICYFPIQNKEVETSETKVAKYRKILLSFARLLLEIETGDIIDLDHSLSTDPDEMEDYLSNILYRQDGPLTHYYHDAIDGCLKFKALIASIQKREPKATFENQTRKAIYTNIIEYLERNLSTFRNRETLQRQRNLRIEARSIESAQPITTSQNPAPPRYTGLYTESPARRSSSPTLEASVGNSPLTISTTHYMRPTSSSSQRHHEFLGDEHPMISTQGLSHPARPSRRHEFEIAIICALTSEYDAVALLFDEFWDSEGDSYGKAAGDHNTYTQGRIGKFNVVLVLLPGMGKASAASATANFRVSYTGVHLALLVGICGGVPKDIHGDDILLGDVIISDCVIQYDFGRLYDDRFRRKDTQRDNLGRADAALRGFIATLQTEHHLKGLRSRTAHYLGTLQMKSESNPSRFAYPGAAEDKLFEASYRHKHGPSSTGDVCKQCIETSGSVCEKALSSLCSELHCDENFLVHRERLVNQAPVYEPFLHFGSIASGDTVMKSGMDRDTIAAEENVIAFEMEGSGVWDNISCLIIKGVCDYADSHKNKKWQGFAAATAASAMKAILERYHKTT